jgi:preprotein translocase subunit SecB
MNGLEKWLMAKNVTIRMEDSRIHSLKFALNDNYEEKESGNSVDVKTDLKFKTNYVYKEKSIHCIFLLNLGGENIPYSLTIEYEGIFTLNKRISKKDANPICKINCPAILFPFMRECVAEITRRAGFPPFMMPSVNFVKANKEQLKDPKKK